MTRNEILDEMKGRIDPIVLDRLRVMLHQLGRNYKDLEDEVRVMRNLQKSYFLTHNREVLSQSKASEKKVDEILFKLSDAKKQDQIQIKFTQ
jgi:CHASE3 domain sensor protein